MWVKKTDREILDDRRKERKRVTILTIIFWVLSSLILVVRPNRYALMNGASPGWELVWSQITSPRRIVASVFISGVLLLTLFWWPRFSGKRRPTSVICPKCEKVKSPDDQWQCQCGGRFVNLDEMKWVKH
jgi:hypothetical protein